MDSLVIQKIIFSVIAFACALALRQSLKYYAKKTQEKFQIRKDRYFSIKRLITFFAVMVFFISLFFIWGIKLKNLWVSLTGIIAMIAVAFFAVWSLIGNILAGIILYFTSPFKINDHIEVLPDEIKGKVLAINTFYTLLIDEDENYINIPNSLFYQKYIKNIRQKKTSKSSQKP
ncbi:MAG: mechanosensitive ion channel family protein [Candidatus Auribacterota bacterium]|jgi:small-conductance mechanosensitive channel